MKKWLFLIMLFPLVCFANERDAWLFRNVNPLMTDFPVIGMEYDGAGTMAMADLGTYYKFTDFQDQGNATTGSFATFDTDNDEIDIGVGGGGTWLGFMHSSFMGDVTHTFHCSIFANGVDTGIEWERYLGATDVGSATAIGIFTIADSQSVDMRCKSDKNTATYTPSHVKLTIMRIGD